MGKTSGKYLNEDKPLENGNVMISRYNIIGTDLTVYVAYRKCPNGFDLNGGFGGSTIHTFGKDWFFKIGTNDLPKDLDKLSRGEERSVAVIKFHHDNYDEAYRLILEAYPDAADGKRDMGSIERIEI